MGDVITLADGSGGLLTHRLIEALLGSGLSNPILGEGEDAAYLEELGIAVTVDSFTVSPPFFPGGDIGKLAACGTINDLACRGARPIYFAYALLLEEGFPKERLTSIISSFSQVCREHGILVVAGDTKVLPSKGSSVERDVFLSVCGLGRVERSAPLGIRRVEEGDLIVVTGDVGRHGAAVGALRFGASLLSAPESDCAPLWRLMERAMDVGGVKAARDCTRGGLATVLCEWARQARGLGVEVWEERIAVSEEVQAFCDAMGFDPLYMACEGRMVMAVEPNMAEELLSAVKSTPEGVGAAVIGRFVGEHPRQAVLKTSYGGMRVLDMLPYEMLPRIC